ncbi:MAG: hypothetical protein WD042_16380 [Phycisphaeraceae bacterium]
MSGYTLTYRSDCVACADGSHLRPDTLGQMPPDELRRAVGDAFDITGEPGDRLTLRGLPPLPRLGARMAGGELIVQGDAGDDLGASMAGGIIRVAGSVGHRVGGLDVGRDRGMTGGEIVIDSDAGDYAGFMMRRGLIAIAGKAGASPGYRMLAGTLVIGQGPLDHPGLEMRRGSILSMDCGGRDAALAPRGATAAPPQAKAVSMPPQSILGLHLTHAGVFDATSLAGVGLIVRRLRELGWPFFSADPLTPSLSPGERGSELAAPSRLSLYHADQFELHRGEVIQWAK